MRAIVRENYGDPSEIRMREVDTPRPGAGEVVVDVRAASVGQDTWHILTGLPLMSRLAFGVRAPRNPRLGTDFAGVVRTVGEGVGGVRVGDRVVGSAPGAFAESVAGAADRLTALPDTVDDITAATLPVSGCTALSAITAAGLGDPCAPGTTVLVVGAAGGVGHLAVQLAAHRGATVTAVCRGEAADLLTKLGAADCIDYSRTDVTATGRRWDVIIDTAGRRPVRDMRRILAPRGTLVVVGGEGGGRLLGGFGREQLSRPAARLAGHRVRGLLSTETPAAVATLVTMVADGHLTPAVHAQFPLERAADAITELRAGHLRGKIVLTLG